MKMDINTILSIVGCVGLTNIITSFDGPFDLIRRLREHIKTFFSGIECGTCCGFWVGLICGFIITLNPFLAIMYAGCVSLGSYLVDRLKIIE